MDITDFMTWFLDEFATLFGNMLNLLGKITFFGTSLLDYSIGLMVLGVVLNILISGVRNRGVREVSRDDQKHKKEDSGDNN